MAAKGGSATPSAVPLFLVTTQLGAHGGNSARHGTSSNTTRKHGQRRHLLRPATAACEAAVGGTVAAGLLPFVRDSNPPPALFLFLIKPATPISFEKHDIEISKEINERFNSKQETNNLD